MWNLIISPMTSLKRRNANIPKLWLQLMRDKKNFNTLKKERKKKYQKERKKETLLLYIIYYIIYYIILILVSFFFFGSFFFFLCRFKHLRINQLCINLLYINTNIKKPSQILTKNKYQSGNSG